MGPRQPPISSKDGIIDGFLVSQETLDHFDPIKRAVGYELVRLGRWILMPSSGCKNV
jgi:hypothetical protein